MTRVLVNLNKENDIVGVDLSLLVMRALCFEMKSILRPIPMSQNCILYSL